MTIKVDVESNFQFHVPFRGHPKHQAPLIGSHHPFNDFFSLFLLSQHQHVTSRPATTTKKPQRRRADPAAAPTANQSVQQLSPRDPATAEPAQLLRLPAQPHLLVVVFNQPQDELVAGQPAGDSPQRNGELRALVNELFHLADDAASLFRVRSVMRNGREYNKRKRFAWFESRFN